MKFASWFTSYISQENRAKSFYKRGMKKAKKHDHLGAIEDYNTSIEMMKSPSDVMAMVLYNRGLVHAAAGDEQTGMDDLESVLEMDEAPINVRTMARLKLARMESRSGKNNA